MSAGSGVTHSEFNGSGDEPVHFLQIWLLPDRAGHAPSYEQRAFAAEGRRGALQLIASPDGAAGSTTIHQDARVFATALEPGQAVTLPLAAGRHAWVQVARGALEVNGQRLVAGDGAALSEEARLILTGGAGGPSEALVFDLA
jgi:redox-sensitive bicupin YhaK (pirin superfamily)